MKWRRPISPTPGQDKAWKRDFRLFWFAQSASVLGDQFREFAIPLIAATVLHVSATELGVLSAAQWVPFLVLALPLGVIIDRHRRRNLLMFSETGRGVLMVGLVIAAAMNALGFPLLLVAVIALGTLTVIYEVGYQSAIPALVPRDFLNRANSRVQATAAAGEIGGPGLGGLFLQLFGMTVTLAANAAAYLVSAVALLLMRSVEPAPVATRRHFVVELRDGVRHVRHDPYLRANVGFSALYNPFAQWVTLLLILYAARTLELTAGQISIVFSAGAVGALLGAATGPRLSSRLRVGTIIFLCAAVECAALLLIPVVDRSWGSVAAISALSVIMAINGAGTALSNVLLITIRQLRTPDALLGRVNATMRTITYGTIPLGALAGGLVGDWLGLRGGIIVGAVLCLATVVWVYISPLRHIRDLEEISPAAPAAPAALAAPAPA
jgi:predicted MFS family arabinose efflux permease